MHKRRLLLINLRNKNLTKKNYKQVKKATHNPKSFDYIVVDAVKSCMKTTSLEKITLYSGDAISMQNHV